MKVRPQAAQCPHSIWRSVRRSIRAISHESSGHSPGNCRALSEQLPRNISRNAGECPRNGWRNSKEASGQLPGKCPGMAVQFPRSSHAMAEECPRDVRATSANAVSPCPCPVLKLTVAASCHDRVQSATAHSSTSDPVRVPSAAADSLPSATIHLRTSSTKSPCPRKIRRLGSFPSANIPKPRNIHRRGLSTVTPC